MLDFSISADKGFNGMLYGVEPDMSCMKPPAFSSVALSLHFTYKQFPYVAVPLY